MIEDIKDTDFTQKVINSSGPVLIDFWADWCGPCRMLTPIIEELSQEMADKIKVVKMNIDENPETPSSLGIRSIPTMMIFKDGKQIAARSGVLPKNSIQEWINSLI